MKAAWVAAATAIILASCGGSEPSHSPTFNYIFPESGKVIRFAGPGISLDAVRKSEPSRPRFDDEWGLTYPFEIENESEGSVEYYADSASPEKTLVSVIANITLPGEVEARNLYQELEAELMRRYGLPEGHLGQRSWIQKSARIGADLRLLDGKSSITIGFYRLEGN